MTTFFLNLVCQPYLCLSQVKMSVFFSPHVNEIRILNRTLPWESHLIPLALIPLFLQKKF